MNAAFFKSMPFFFWFELGAFIAALVSLKELKRNYLRWFVPFLLFIVVVEICGSYFNRVLHKPNAWIFNISVPVEYLFYTFIYYHGFSHILLKKISFVSGVAYFFFCILLVVTHSIIVFQNGILMAGNLMAVFFSCSFFYENLRKDEVIDLAVLPVFWITCGVFLFNLGELTYTLFRPALTQNRWDVTLTIFKSINNKLIFWLYGTIILGLLCVKSTRYRKISDFPLLS